MVNQVDPDASDRITQTRIRGGTHGDVPAISRLIGRANAASKMPHLDEHELEAVAEQGQLIVLQLQPGEVVANPSAASPRCCRRSARAVTAGPARSGTPFATPGHMITDPGRWDDYVLAGLLLLISLPRVALALLYDHPLGVEGTISMFLVLLALVMVVRRRS